MVSFHFQVRHFLSSDSMSPQNLIYPFPLKLITVNLAFLYSEIRLMIPVVLYQVLQFSLFLCFLILIFRYFHEISFPFPTKISFLFSLLYPC